MIYYSAILDSLAAVAAVFIWGTLERLGVDVTGPHPASAKGNCYVLTIIDHFTKWVELILMRNQEAPSVVKLLFDRVICKHGCPLQILTDRGTNFESQLFLSLIHI